MQHSDPLSVRLSDCPLNNFQTGPYLIMFPVLFFSKISILSPYFGEKKIYHFVFIAIFNHDLFGPMAESTF